MFTSNNKWNTLRKLELCLLLRTYPTILPGPIKKARVTLFLMASTVSGGEEGQTGLRTSLTVHPTEEEE
jgi:hypothetical protein